MVPAPKPYSKPLFGQFAVSLFIPATLDEPFDSDKILRKAFMRLQVSRGVLVECKIKFCVLKIEGKSKITVVGWGVVGQIEVKPLFQESRQQSKAITRGIRLLFLRVDLM